MTVPSPEQLEHRALPKRLTQHLALVAPVLVEVAVAVVVVAEAADLETEAAVKVVEEREALGLIQTEYHQRCGLS